MNAQSPSPSKTTDVVFTFSFDTWATSIRRKIFPSDVIAKDLLVSPRVRKLLVADPYTSVLGAVRRRVRGEHVVFPCHERASLFAPLRIRRQDPIDPNSIRGIYARYIAKLETTAKARGLVDPVLLTTHPFVAASAIQGGFWKHVSYYGWDDWAAHPTFLPYKKALLESYASIASAGHRVIGVTPRIVERIASSGFSTVIPNGLFPSEWTDRVAAPSWFTDLPQPRLLYTGGVDSRIDIDCIFAVSQAFPSASISIVGPVQDAAAVSPLRELPNVHFAPLQPREVIRGITFAADVALIPHVVSDLTQAMSPLKMYEYLAAGRPVVATDLEPIRAIREVRRAGSPAEFVQEIRSALALGAASEEDRMAFVKNNSWSARLELLYDAAF